MPGLGGKALSETHALETADALNQINPHFIRLRTLAIPNRLELYEEYQAGKFEKCTDLMMAGEILLFIESLEGITSVVKSDHILNLFQEVEGKLPDDKEYMTGIIKSFLAMGPEQQCIYQAGRRLGVFAQLSDMEDSYKVARVEQVCRQMGVTADNIDATIEELTKRFV